MSITSVTQKRTGRTGLRDQLWRRTYTRTYIVTTGDPEDDEAVVLAGTGKNLGDVHPHDNGAFITSISASCSEDDGCQWEVVVTWGQFDPNQQPQNPIEWPIKISWGSATFEESVSEDVDDVAILNSAGDYFDPPITRDRSRPILRIVRNEERFDPILADTYTDTLNNDTFFGQDPGTWKCAPITAELEFNQDSGTTDGYYYVVTYEFHFNPFGWTERVLDQGMRVRDGSNNLIPAVQNGLPVTSPILLDGSGAALAPGGDPVFLEFDTYRSVDFGALDLDPSGAPGQQ